MASNTIYLGSYTGNKMAPGSILQGGANPQKTAGSNLQVTSNPQRTLNPQANNVNPNIGVTGGSTIPLSTGSTAPSAPVVTDPWANTPWGSAANYQRAVSDFNTTKNNTYQSITDMIADRAASTKSSVLDFLTNIQGQQKDINNMAVKNEMTRNDGRRNVLDMVAGGLAGSRAMLLGANATSSSATEAFEKAWARQGQKGNQAVERGYNLGEQDVKNAQEALGVSVETFKRHVEENRTQIVNGIVSQAISALGQLDAQAQSASLPDRVNFDVERERIRNEALAALAQVDAILSEGLNKTKASSKDENRAKAAELGQVDPAELGFNPSILPLYLGR